MIPEQWLYDAGGVGLFCLTFLSEDSATLAGALLAALGKLAGPVAFTACFLGIWMGDLGLYLMARRWGRPVLARFKNISGKLEQSEACFAHHGWLALVMCRFVPGTRLPTFLVAGLLGMPAGRFAVITGLLAAAWVGLIFAVVGRAGSVTGIFMGAVGILILLLARRPLLSLARKMRGSPAVQRWLQWEFWPAWLFYLPIGVNYLRLAIKYRSLSLPTCANPGMFTGGLIGESKYETLRILEEGNPDFVAESFFLSEELGVSRFVQLLAGMDLRGLNFPIVLKPDVAQRGSGFKVARTSAEASAYLARVNVPVVAQRYIFGPHEAGLFYYRFPSEKTGRIFAITEKIFPVILGDGNRTVEELIRADARAAIMADTYLERFDRDRGCVLPSGQSLRLVEAGNHAQGCIFRDGMSLWSEQLEARVDEISRSIPGFYIGRYDVRFDSVDELRRGQGFSILELNGAASEATSAYDAGKSLAAAYKLLFEQWEIVFSIAAENRRAGYKVESLGTILSEWREYRERSVCHPIAD